MALAIILSNAFDGNTSTKYLNFGNCGFEDAGLRTGLYFTLKRNQSIVTGLRFYTANDCPNRDPLMVTLEGSNQTGELLHLGSSWNLIYSGLATDPGRESRGIKQSFSNSTPYASYRLKSVTTKIRSNILNFSYTATVSNLSIISKINIINYSRTTGTR
jgi:hypothetical protein